MAFAYPATNPAAFGIAPAHWRVLVRYSAEKDYVLALRTGKRAAVRWIEQGFPAKPLELKIKVDRELGLLMARTPEARDEAWRNGRPVLEPDPSRPRMLAARIAARDAWPGHRFDPGHLPWARAGVVLDPATRLPITSDYDLAAVVDTVTFHYDWIYGSMAGGRNRTNHMIEAIARDLNRRFGNRRIVHGTEAQYSGSMAHDDDDEIVIFHPNGDVQHLAPMPVLQTDLLLQEIILSYFPDRAHVFHH
jgi:hypothetical protein